MEGCEWEGDAGALYAAAGADVADPPGPVELARGLGIPVRYGPRLVARSAALTWTAAGGHRIYVRRGLPPAHEAFLVYHELAEWWLRDRPPSEHREQDADQLAYRLRAPRQAFSELIRLVGLDLPELARASVASETGAALRYLEVSGTPGVVVTPRLVRARGEPWGWPEARELRSLATAQHLPRGVERVPIGDRRGAVLLLAS